MFAINRQLDVLSEAKTWYVGGTGFDGKCIHPEWRMYEAGPLAVRNYVWPKEGLQSCVPGPRPYHPGTVWSTLRESRLVSALPGLHTLYADTVRSTIRDFCGTAELKIDNEGTYRSTPERLGDPKQSVKRIKQECQRQLGGLLPVVKRLHITKKLLLLPLEGAFYFRGLC